MLDTHDRDQHVEDSDLGDKGRAEEIDHREEILNEDPTCLAIIEVLVAPEQIDVAEVAQHHVVHAEHAMQELPIVVVLFDEDGVFAFIVRRLNAVELDHVEAGEEHEEEDDEDANEVADRSERIYDQIHVLSELVMYSEPVK